MSVTLHTTFGALTIKLFVKEAPRSCRNFLELAKSSYYDGCLFHLLDADLYIQTGDPTGTGMGGESIYGPRFDDEINSKLNHGRIGTVSYANAGKLNTNASQFFVTLKEAPELDGRHTVFGLVAEETCDTLRSMASIKTKNNRPLRPIKLFSATINQDPWAGEPLPVGARLPAKPFQKVDEESGLINMMRKGKSHQGVDNSIDMVRRKSRSLSNVMGTMFRRSADGSSRDGTEDELDDDDASTMPEGFEDDATSSSSTAASHAATSSSSNNSSSNSSSNNPSSSKAHGSGASTPRRPSLVLSGGAATGSGNSSPLTPKAHKPSLKELEAARALSTAAP